LTEKAKPFLCNFGCSIFSASAVIEASNEERQEAILCCSLGEGTMTFKFKMENY
jgi:hypothetical protein